MTEYKETPFFDGFDVPEDKNDNNATENNNIPAMEWLDQMLFRIYIFRLSENKTKEQKATAANLTKRLEFIKGELLDSITRDKLEDYENIYESVQAKILDFRFYLNIFARPLLKDNEFIEYLFMLCSKMVKKLQYMRPLYEGRRKRLPKTHKAHFAKMPECAKKYYIAEIKALGKNP